MKLLLLLFSSALGKYFNSRIDLTQKTDWKYYTKFAADIGKFNWTFRARMINGDPESEGYVQLSQLIYISEKWNDVIDKKNCEDKESLSTKAVAIQLPLNCSWSDMVQGTILQKQKHFWYFALAMCELDSKVKLMVELTILNADGSQFSSEEKGLVWVYCSAFLFYLVFLFKIVLKAVVSFKSFSEVELHEFVLNSAVLVQVTGIAIAALHTVLYIQNGYGVGFFYHIYHVSEELSKSIISIFLIIIGNGWLVKHKEFRDGDIYIPSGIFILILNLIIAVVDISNFDSYGEVNKYSGVVGVIRNLISISLWIWLMISVSNLAKESNPKIIEFLSMFGICSSVYYLNQTVLALLLNILDIYTRNKILVFFSNVSQIFVFSYLSNIFNEKSNFFRISALSPSSLPGKFE